MATAVIQGSSSGIGQELARFLLHNTRLSVVALTHQRESTVKDAILSTSSGSKDHRERLSVIDGVDVLEERGLENASKRIEEQGGKGDVRLIACLAGVLHPEKSLASIDLKQATHSFQVNTLGHLMTYKHLVPLIATRRQFDKLAANWGKPGDPAAGVVDGGGSLCWSLSARVGSIGDNERGGWYSYRASKAALNQIIRCLDHELVMKNSSALAMAYHPGTVLTPFTAPILGSKAKASLEKGTFELDDAVRRMVRNMASATDERRGGFIDWRGERVAW